MNRRIGAGICVVVLAAGAMVSCTKSGDDTLTRDEFIEELTTNQSIPVDLATCLADGLEEAGIKVDKNAEPADEDKDQATEIAGKCFTEVGGVAPSEDPGLESTTTVAPSVDPGLESTTTTGP